MITPTPMCNSSIGIMSRVRNITAFARNWCSRRDIVGEMADELVQEAWVAALEHDYDRDAIGQAMNAFRMREMRRPEVSFTDLGEDIDGDTFAERDGGLSMSARGLHYDSYHGWVRDDV